jgi:Sec-independent protein translocase protein TatA
MMHNNRDYYSGGMHVGWWILILVAVVVIVAVFGRDQKTK